MVRKPLVSCITPTYNRHHELKKMIRMFIEQTYTNCELIIVDDSELTFDMKQFNKYDSIKYIRLSKRHSIGAKRNIAVSNARGTLIAFMDDDDYHGPDRIRKQVESMNNPFCHLSVPSSIYYKRKNGNKKFKITNKLQQKIYHKGLITTCMMFRKSLFKYAQFRNINLAEDAWFIEDLKREKKHLTISTKLRLKETDFTYVIHENNTWYSPELAVCANSFKSNHRD